MIQENFLSAAAAHHDRDAGFQVLPRVVVLVILGQLHGYAHRQPARDDGYFVDRVGVGHQRRHHRVASFMIRGGLLFLLADDQRAPLDPHHDLVLGLFKIRHGDGFAAGTRRQQGRFVHQVGKISAGKARCAAGDHRKLYVIGQRDLFDVNLENAHAPVDIGPRHHHAAVKASGPQQRRVQHVRAVGGRHQDDPFIRFKPVHLDQQLVQGLLALVVPAAKPCSAMPADGVNFINEDDARGVFLALIEQVAHAAGAHAHKHFHKIRAADGKERNVGFPGDGARQQGFSGAGRTDQQHPFRDAPAELLKFLRIAQEFDDLLQLFLGFIHAGNIFEGDFFLLRGKQPGAALPERQRLVPARLHLAHHENPEPDDQQERSGLHQIRHPGIGGAVLHGDDDAFFAQDADQVGVIGGDHRLQLHILLLELAAHLVGGVERDLAHIALLGLVHEFAERELALA